MSEADRSKWNQRYREDTYRKNNPVALLAEWLPQLRVGRALDLACGAGRNAFTLARAGFDVDAVDISSEGLRLARRQAESQGLVINWLEQDLDHARDFGSDYDLIIVFWFVDLELVGELGKHLAPGGILISQQHLRSGEQVIGPGNPDFRVAPGALRSAARGLELLFYDESVETTPEGERLASARLVARKP